MQADRAVQPIQEIVPGNVSLHSEAVRIDTSIVPFNALDRLADFERNYPVALRLFRDVGIHPTDSPQVYNPYRQEVSQESFANVGEHCIAVAWAAQRIAQRLADVGAIQASEVEGITERALVHDLNKPYEVMRKSAQRAGLTEDIYSVSAYEKLIPLLDTAGASAELVSYMARAGVETGHNSLAGLIVAGPEGLSGLVNGSLAEKIVHLADDMTFTNQPREGQRAVTSFLTCWERALASQFIEKYPFLWSEGLAHDASGKIAPVRNINKLEEGQQLLGSYIDLQVAVAGLIAREIKLLIDPAAPESPENFVKKLIRAES